MELGLHRTSWSLIHLKTTLISNMKRYIKEWCWLSLKIKSLHSHLNVFNKYGCPKRLSWWGIPPGHTWNEIHIPMLVHSQIMTNVHSYIGWLAQCTRACISNIVTRNKLYFFHFLLSSKFSMNINMLYAVLIYY